MVITFFNKNLFGIAYHEVGGLVLTLLFVLHVAVNLKTFVAMCRKFEKVPAEVKIGAVLDMLLILCFLWIALSGVMISHTIFKGISSFLPIFRLGHLFAGGLSVILLGIHIGLHLRKSRSVAVPVMISILILCLGAYGMAGSSFVDWLGLPFGGISHVEHQARLHAQSGHGGMQAGTAGQARMPGAAMSWGERIESVVMFLFLISSFAVVTYWMVRIKKHCCKIRSYNVKAGSLVK